MSEILRFPTGIKTIFSDLCKRSSVLPNQLLFQEDCSLSKKHHRDLPLSVVAKGNVSEPDSSPNKFMDSFMLNNELNTICSNRSSVLIQRDEYDSEYVISRFFDDDKPFDQYTEDITDGPLPHKLIHPAAKIEYSSTDRFDVNDIHGVQENGVCSIIANKQKRNLNKKSSDGDDDLIANASFLIPVVNKKLPKKQAYNTCPKTFSSVNSTTEDVNDVSKISQKRKFENKESNNNLEREPVKKKFFIIDEDNSFNPNELYARENKEIYELEYRREKTFAKISNGKTTKFENITFNKNDFKSPILQQGVNNNFTKLLDNEVQVFSEDQYYTAIDEIQISQSSVQEFRNGDIAEKLQEEPNVYSIQIRNLMNLSPPPIETAETSNDKNLSGAEIDHSVFEGVNALSLKSTEVSSLLPDKINGTNEDLIDLDRTYISISQTGYINLCSSDSEDCDEAEEEVSEIFNFPINSEIVKENDIEIIDLTILDDSFDNSIDNNIINLTGDFDKSLKLSIEENVIDLTDDKIQNYNTSIDKHIVNIVDDGKSVNTCSKWSKIKSVKNQCRRISVEVAFNSDKVKPINGTLKKIVELTNQQKGKSCSYSNFKNSCHKVASREDTLLLTDKNLLKSVNNVNEVINQVHKTKTVKNVATLKEDAVLKSDCIVKHPKKQLARQNQEERLIERLSCSYSGFEDFDQKVSSDHEAKKRRFAQKEALEDLSFSHDFCEKVGLVGDGLIKKKNVSKPINVTNNIAKIDAKNVSDWGSDADCPIESVDKEIDENDEKGNIGDGVLVPKNKIARNKKVVIISNHVLQRGSRNTKLINEQDDNIAGKSNGYNLRQRENLRSYNSDSGEVNRKSSRLQKINLQTTAKDDSESEFLSVGARMSAAGRLFNKSNSSKPKTCDLNDVQKVHKKSHQSSNGVHNPPKTDCASNQDDFDSIIRCLQQFYDKLKTKKLNSTIHEPKVKSNKNTSLKKRRVT